MVRDTTLLLDTPNGYVELDLFQDLPINVNFSELKIGDLDVRTSPYSNTFTIPGTNNNSIIFEHFFEVNGTDFNALNTIKCVVQNRGTDIFRGSLRLNAVVQYFEYYEFEVYITSDVSDMASLFQELSLRNLDWFEYQHDLNYSAITESWKANPYDNSGLLNGDILYPLINYGYEYISGTTTPTFEFSVDNDVPNGSITFSGNPMPTTYFKPAIRIKAVIDKLFNAANLTYNSTFFDSEYFKSIYMDTAQNGTLGPELPSGLTNANFYKVYTSNPISVQPVTGNPYRLPFNSFQQDGFDPLQNFTFENTITPTASYHFQVPYTGAYFWNVRFGYELFDLSSAVPCYFRLRITRSNSPTDEGTILWQTPGVGLAAIASKQNYNVFFSGAVTAGEYIKAYIFLEGGATYAGVYLTGYDGLTFNDPLPMWDLYASPFLASSTTIDMKYQMPDVDGIDFFKSIINQFNLVVTNGETQNNFIVEPIPIYFNEADRTERDFNQYLDLRSPIKIEPLSFDLDKEVRFRGTYNEDETLNRLFFEQNQRVFGEKKFITPFTIPKGTREIETMFSPLTTDFISGSTNIVIPQLWKFGDSDNYLPFQKDPHLFFFTGNRYFYKDFGSTASGNQRYWYLFSGGTAVPQSTYPCVSHLSNLDAPDSLVSELNFNTDFDYYFGPDSNLASFSQNNTFNYFWKTYLENTYSPEARRYTGKFILSPEIYAQLKFTDKIFIKDASYRIDVIKDANLVAPELTEISLIKDIYPYYSPSLYAPPYPLAPNTPYPLVPPITTYAFTAVSNFDQFLVCDRNTPLVTYYSTDPSGLVEGATIYTDSGATTLAEEGTYLRLIGSPIVFVVDITGEALETNPC